MINIAEILNKSLAPEITTTTVSFGDGKVRLTGRVIFPHTVRPVPGVVLCHGFGSSYRAVESSARIMARGGVAVLIFNFRGHRGSEGIVDENIVDDVVSAWNFLSGYPGIDKKRIALAGHSMGAMAAILAARQVKPKALIAMSCPPEINGDLSALSFKIPEELMREEKEIKEYPRDGSLPWTKGLGAWISRTWMRLVGYQVKVDWRAFFKMFSSAKLRKAIRELPDCAMLFVHCLGDDVTPCTTALALYATARGPKELLLAPGGFHASPLLVGALRHDWTNWAVRTLVNAR